MTPEAQRIAIAEACGYAVIGRLGQYDPPVGVAPDKQVLKHNVKPIPDYLSDLNASKALIDHLRTSHGYDCVIVCEDGKYACTFIHQEEEKEFKVISFSLEHSICQAFLRTLSLWED